MYLAPELNSGPWVEGVYRIYLAFWPVFDAGSFDATQM